MWLFLKNLLFTVLVPGFVAGWVPFAALLHRPALERPSAFRQFAAGPLLLAGVILYLVCLWEFGAKGRGTPMPFDRPRKLLVRGPYAWLRNPMYFSLLLIIFGEALYFSNVLLLLYAVFVASACQLVVVAAEEEALRRRYGALYSDYCNGVNRWQPRKPRPRVHTVSPFDLSRK